MASPSPQSLPESGLRPALAAVLPALKPVLLLGVLINLLSLAPTLYMLEVYDRVVNSRNHTTLAMLTVLVVGLYAIMQVLEWARGQMLQGAGLRFESRLADRVFDAAFVSNLRLGRSSGQPLNDLRVLRDFFAAPALTALMDAPLALAFLLLIFIISPFLGWFSLVVAIAQTGLAWATERLASRPLAEANQGAIEAQQYAVNTLRNAQVVQAMGMLDGLQARWMARQNKVLLLQAQASDHAGGKGALAKLLQNILLSGLLGLACWLSLQGDLTGGGSMMIVASILGGKALAPLVQLIANWKPLIEATDSWRRLERLLDAVPSAPPRMPLPAHTGALGVEGVVAAAPGSQQAILRGVSFALQPGKSLVVVGPSAAGKSTLARLLTGVWPASSGKVRLDGVDVFQWNKAELGPQVGYLPQSIELFDGSIAENIARFGTPDLQQVQAVAQAVGLHEAIMAMPAGYDSRIGEDGAFLSGGQRQRLGLARALYGNPRFVVLDEPNSSLDEAGEQALLRALAALKAAGTTLVFITHRTGMLALADFMLVLQAGQVAAFGPRDEVLARLAQATQAGARPAAMPGAAAAAA